MKYQPPKRGLGKQAVNSRGATNALERRAPALAAKVEAGTPRRSGATADSTEVESGHRSASGDRPAVRIVQRGRGTKTQPGAPVPANFRQRRDYMLRALGGAS